LKIYQYLRAGRPIVATHLRTHTQVLTDDVALLTAPTPEAFGAGLVRVLTDPALASTLGRNAQHLADTQYTYEAYLARTRDALAHVQAGGAQAS
jgi:glycosyltransferase involved in cell wall biosynthesis